jgi:transposase-like protein
MSTLTPGISALQLQRQIGLGSYETALSLCRRLRSAMVNPLRDPLCGVVEVDEAYIGGPRRGEAGRSSSKSLVVVAVENRGDHTGRVRLGLVPDASKESLHGFIQGHIAKGAQVNTDDWDGYKGLELHGYQHRPRIQGDPARAAKILPWVHRVMGNLKTWLRGTHHGRIERRHLQSYLDEFTFRYNRRRSREHSFLTLLVLATRLTPTARPVIRRALESSG